MRMELRKKGILIDFTGADCRDLARITCKRVGTRELPSITYKFDTQGWDIHGLATIGNNAGSFLDMRSFIWEFIDTGAFDEVRGGKYEILISLQEMLDATDIRKAAVPQ